MVVTFSTAKLAAVACGLLLIASKNALVAAFTQSANSVNCRMLPRGASSIMSFEPIEEEPSRSIGDIVQGLHGSKYQFGDSALNFEGQQFAETGYGSSTPSLDEEDYSKEPIPAWALRLKDTLPSAEAGSVLRLASGYGSVEIKNEERSWEKYYAFIVGGDDETQDSLVVEPRVGILAPRGGTESFRDAAQITVQGETRESENVFLVVGTEAESWIYKIS
eukprot:scaffold23554_cov142-Cylindrotheca_fusiformis.AAC.1